MPTKEKSKLYREHYRLSPEEQREVTFVYDEVESMIEKRNKTWPQFNDRTLEVYIDDSEKRLNGYVPSKESQGKSEYQSNVFKQVTRNKLKALVAATSLSVPDVSIRAVSADGGLDLRRAEVMKNLVKYSQYQTNPEVEIFFEGWEGAGKGTVIKYEGYLKSKIKRKTIRSYDLITGNIEFDEEEVEVDNQCFEEHVPLTELYVKDFHVFDIQDQPAIARIQYKDKQDVEREFGHYKNFKYVRSKKAMGQYQGETDTFYYKRWGDRVGEDIYEVIRYYNRFQDKYDIIINGVPLLIAPMLWGKKKKLYPYSKSIFEPFGGKDFFYGKSLPDTLQGDQDAINSWYNMALDKTYRSLQPPLLAGLANKDLLELEADTTGMQDTLYVEDVAQVKYMDIPGVGPGEVEMLRVISAGIDQSSLDITQQGIAGRGVTAREIVIANENAKKLKGVFFMFLTDLWVQKTKLRILNILQNYTRPMLVEVIGEEGQKELEERFRTFLVDNAEFPDGSEGTLAIQMIGPGDKMPTQTDLDIEEATMEAEGESFQKIAIRSDYLDSFDYDAQVVPASLHQKDKAEARATIEEKMQLMASFFPQIFQMNQRKLFEDFIRTYDDSPDRYDVPPTQGVGPEGLPPQEKGPASLSSPESLPPLTPEQTPEV